MDQLTSCEWLKEQIDKDQLKDDVIILDVSWSSTDDKGEEYKKAHIPGARYLNVMDAINDEYFSRNIPDLQKFQDSVQKVGINNDSKVILYSNSDFGGYFLSGRAWWTFKRYGHDNVSILDGGWKKWIKEGGKQTGDVPQVVKGTFTAKLNADYRYSFDDVMEKFKSKSDIQLCDSRTTEKYEKIGHIKGAINLPLSNLIDNENGVLKSVEEIKKEFSKAGVDFDKPIATYCTSGMSSCSLLLAANMCQGKGALYHGGYTEWSKRATELIEK